MRRIRASAKLTARSDAAFQQAQLHRRLECDSGVAHADPARDHGDVDQGVGVAVTRSVSEGVEPPSELC